MNQVEQIWRSKTDEELTAAAAKLAEYTAEGERIIRAELEARGLPVPPATVRPVERESVSTKKASPDAVVSHWSTLIENLQASPLQFYQSVEAALARRQVPDTVNSRVDYAESGLLSAKREYLRVTREKLAFDICGAPFGTGFFVSWWLTEEKPKINALLKIVLLFVMLGLSLWILSEMGLVVGTITIAAVVAVGFWIVNLMASGGEFNDDIVRVLPILGPLYNWLFKADTYYRIDTTLMFQKAVHNAVLEVIDEMTSAKGIRALSETERKPVMREFYQRKAA